jgi:hypothetical protein
MMADRFLDFVPVANMATFIVIAGCLVTRLGRVGRPNRA